MVFNIHCNMYLKMNTKPSVCAACSGITRRADQLGSNCSCRGAVGLAVMTRQENKYWAANRVEEYVGGAFCSGN